MAKGYWIARVTVHDPEAYKTYIAANAKAFEKYNAKFLVRSGQFELVEGQAAQRNIMIEFPDYETAKACYHSPEYQSAKDLRDPVSEADLIIIEGYDGPQPGS